MEEFKNTDGSQNLQKQDVHNQQYDQSAQGGQTAQDKQAYAPGNQSQGQVAQGTQQDQVAQGRGSQAAGRGASRDQALQPPVDVVEDAGGITLYADLPGVTRENLNLHLETGSLTIEGEVTLEAMQGLQSNYAEIRVPHYRRTFTLSRELDGEKASAEFKNGVLKLRIPKAAHAQARKIQVQGA